MRYDSLLVEVATTPAYVLLVFGLFLALFHITLVRLSTHNDIFWKRVDYVWLSAAAIGLLATSAQLNRTMAETYIRNGEADRTVAMYGLLRHFLDGQFWVCAPRHRTEFSPAEFDDIVREQQDLCKKAKDLSAKLPRVLPADYPTLESLGYERIGDSAKYEPDFGKMLEGYAAMYRLQQKRYADLMAATKKSDWEFLANLIGPLLIAFALALRITKVSGEIKNAKRKLAA